MSAGSSGLALALRRHYPEYLCEALGLGLFMLSAGAFGVWIFGAASPLVGRDPLLLRALMGLAMGGTAVALIYSPWGRRSGAHFNPATTLTFWRLGKIETADAAWYAAAQLAGGVCGVLVVRALFGAAFTQPPVSSVATLPGARGAGVAFLAEVAITALLMTVVLHATNAPAWAKRTGLLAGALVALYITFESPLSGMSMNPARTLASALPSGMFTSLWVYLLAPPIGMLVAAELWVRRRRQGPICAKVCHDDRHRCIFRCGYCSHDGSTPSTP